jgi:hypothetical protein
VYVLRQKLITFLTDERQRECLPKTDPNGTMYYGTVTGGNGYKGHFVSFDIFPDTCKVVMVRRGNIAVLDKGADEPSFDPKRVAEMEAELLASGDKRKSPETHSEDQFASMDENALKTAAIFECKYHDNKPPIVWKIFGDDENIEYDSKYKTIKEKSRPSFEIDFENKKLHENFFVHVWPDMTGFAARMDKFLLDPRATFHQTYVTKMLSFTTRSMKIRIGK